MKLFAKLWMLVGVLILSACASPYAIERGAYGDYIAGQHAKFERDTDKAAEYFKRALDREPNNEFILQEAFSLAIMDGHFNKALELANDLEDIGAENSTASILLSLNAFKRGRYGEVETFLEKAKGTGFDSLMAPIIRAWVEAEYGNLDDALAALEVLKAIPLFEPYQRDHAAFIYDHADHYAEAEAAYMAILTGPGPVSIHPVLSLGNMLVRTNQIERADELYGRFELMWEDNRKLKQAIIDMEDIRVRDVSHPDPVEALGYALLRAASEIARDNTYAPAILYARLSTFMDPKRDDTVLLLSNLFMVQHQPEATLRTLENIDNSSLFSDLARAKEAHAYNEMGEVDKAINLLEGYLRDKPDDLSVRTSLGDIYQVHDRFLEAKNHYSIAISSIDELSTENWYLVFSRGISNERLGNWDAAEADFMKALTLKPNEPQVLNYLGYSWVDRGERYDEARRMIERAVVQRPNDGAIMDSLGWVLYLLGDFDTAVEKLERAIELIPNDPLINDHLGDAYWMVGREIEARFQWRHALALEPDAEIIATIETKIRLGLTILQALENNADASHD